MWTWEEMRSHTVLYLQGKIDQKPWDDYPMGLCNETKQIIPVLCALNMAGFLTVW
jgi:hypothetical protein